jgi:iron complex outermembrane receptor protein
MCRISVALVQQAMAPLPACLSSLSVGSTLSLSWDRGDWASQLTQNFNTGYHDQNLVAPEYFRDIESYSIWNWTVNYRGFKNMAISAGISNLLNARPPVTNHNAYTYGYLSSAASPVGRALNVRLSYDF